MRQYREFDDAALQGDTAGHHGDEPSGFAATLTAVHGNAVLAVRGEIDLASADELWQAVERASTYSGKLVIDLSQTTFIDSTGLAVLVKASRRLGQIREALVLRAPSPTARKLLEITGVDALVTIDEGEHPRP